MVAVSSNAGRPWGRTGAPYAPEAPWKEAAKYLRLIVGRYLKGNALLREVEEAMVILRAAAPVAGDAPKPSDPLLEKSVDLNGPITDASFRRLYELARDNRTILEMQVQYKTSGMVVEIVSSVGLPRKIETKLTTESAARAMIFALEANTKPKRGTTR